MGADVFVLNYLKRLRLSSPLKDELFEFVL